MKKKELSEDRALRFVSEVFAGKFDRPLLDSALPDKNRFERLVKTNSRNGSERKIRDRSCIRARRCAAVADRSESVLVSIAVPDSTQI